MKITLALLMIAALAACAAPRAHDPRWMAFADCAGAYRVNAAIADPSRPASMTAMVSESADDYEKAARDRYVLEPHTTAEQAQRDVAARVSAKVKAFSGKPRGEVEKFIDTCPQTE
jgi:hypothetical protein